MASDDWASENDLPNLEEMGIALDVIQTRTVDTPPDQLGRDGEVLASYQERLLELLSRGVPAAAADDPAYQPDALRAVLERVNESVDVNRTLQQAPRS